MIMAHCWGCPLLAAPADVHARLCAERVGRELGQPIITENRGGAVGAIGAL